MDFALSEEQQLARETFARFSTDRIKPRAAAIDEAGQFPQELFGELGDLGLFGMRYPESVGGAGVGFLSLCLALGEVARASLSVAAAATMQSLMATDFLHVYGDEGIHERLLQPAIQGEKIGAICITEPDAGSDLSAITTSAERVNGGYRLNGQKTWITSAPVADFFTVFARTGKENRLTVFLVEKGFSGLVIGRAIEKMGCWALPTSEVFFEDCFVPDDHRLGEEGEGEVSLRRILGEIRTVTGALAIGVARGALDEALQYAAERKQFGRSINCFQAIQMKLAEMATDLEAATHLVHYAAWLKDSGASYHREAAMAKLFASECATEICDKATRVLGAYGYAREFPAQRYLRDIRFTLYGGGTSEIIKLIIAKDLTT
ncbi:MAG: acyl-CoA dehydrogenase family protein [Phycisphaerales bacterium]|nr:MAG: acyl-CoA dehydrogenase family protein [Phycisphaerales bacterium]